jgi:hypothetical protein
MRDRVIVTPYDAEWSKLFSKLGAALRDALGDIALRIDHIGSTSIPGLAAKPVIDPPYFADVCPEGRQRSIERIPSHQHQLFPSHDIPLKLTGNNYTGTRCFSAAYNVRG